MRHGVYATVACATLATASSFVYAEEFAASSDPPQTPAARTLDLRIPPIASLFTPEQIAAILDKARDPDMDEVEVEGRREPPKPVTPTVWRGIAAPLWALLNPTHSWRIFAPLPPDQLRNGALRPVRADATYREPAARTALDL